MQMYELQQMQSLPLRMKEKKSKWRITEWHEAHEGMIYPSISGGLDSTVLADMVKEICPEVPFVFCNTGQEYPEVAEFAKTIATVIIRPEHSYAWAFDYYGYPVVSKSVSHAISRYRTATDDVQRNLRKSGGINPTTGKVQKMGVVPKKYHYLLDAPFKISDKCCEVLKKRPMHKYNFQSGRVPMTGELAEESNRRKMDYLKHGCNSFGAEHKSTPMGFWTHEDVLQYILDHDLKYCSIYGDIVRDPVTKKLKTTGERQTGCFGCMFGCQLEDPNNNRFHRMHVSHPERYEICIKKYGQGKVLDFMGIKY